MEGDNPTKALLELQHAHPMYVSMPIPSAIMLRDWFAGMALQGMLAGATSRSFVRVDHDAIIKSAYMHADAMLKERERA